MNKVFYIFFLFLITISCEIRQDETLANDEVIKKFFDKDEINDLEKILIFFNKEICVGNKDFDIDCFKDYLKNAKKGYLKKDLMISKEVQKKLLSSISKSTYNKIWYNSFYFKNNGNDSIAIIMIKPESKYMNFIKELGKSRTHIREYYNAASSIGVVINAGTVNYVFYNYSKFNLKDEKERLILAIHYISLSEEFK